MASVLAVAMVSCFVSKFCNASEDEIRSELSNHLYCYSSLERLQNNNGKSSKSTCATKSTSAKVDKNTTEKKSRRMTSKIEDIRRKVEASMKRKERLRRPVVLKKGLLEASDSDSDEDSSSSDGGSSDDSERTPEPSCPHAIDMPIARRKRSTVGVSPLRHAARNNNYPAMLCALRSNKYDPNESDPVHGQSPLHFAADGGYIDCVALLLESGANPNASDLDGMSVLQSAVLGGSVTVARMLLENGANPDHYDMDGDSPRILAVEYDENDENGRELRDLFVKEFPPLRRKNYSRRRNTRRGSCSSGLSVINEDEELKGMIYAEHDDAIETSYCTQ